MSEDKYLNKLTRHRNLPRDVWWPDCFICLKNKPTGFTLEIITDADEEDEFVVSVCDDCLYAAKKAVNGEVKEHV